jgi:hypothetical protein
MGSTTQWIGIGAIVVASWVLTLSPFLLAIYLVVRAGAALPRKFVFVFVATSLAYGIAIFAYCLLVLPLLFVAIYFIPSMRGSGTLADEPSWLHVLNWVGMHSHWIVPVAIGLLAAIVVPRLFRLWPRISNAVA